MRYIHIPEFTSSAHVPRSFLTVTLPVSGVTVNINFDPAEIDARYAEERRVRIKPEGLGQFNGLEDVLQYTDRDFYSTRLVRPAVEEDVEVIVLGGAFGGILAGGGHTCTQRAQLITTHRQFGAPVNPKHPGQVKHLRQHEEPGGDRQLLAVEGGCP